MTRSDFSEEGLRRALILERCKTLCDDLFNKRTTKADFEKKILTNWKLYKSPMASWANKFFGGDEHESDTKRLKWLRSYP